MIEAHLNERIRELEDTLRSIRDICASNLASPGNEDDSLNYVVDAATSVLYDDYEFVE